MTPEWPEDPDLRRTFDWFVDILGHKEWQRRKEVIAKYTQLRWSLGQNEVPLYEEATRFNFLDDLAGWYLFLAESYLVDINNYEFAQGSRIIPIFIKIGRHLDHLKKCIGVEGRIRKMLTVEKKQPDSTLFELLVALLYSSKGCKHVEFIKETPKSKTPDLFVRGNNSEWFIECKRLSKTSDYSFDERKKWLRIWEPVKRYLVNNRMALVLDVEFHVEMASLDDNFLEKNLLGKLALAASTGVIIDNEIVTVKTKSVDFKKIREATKDSDIKWPSSFLAHLIVGDHDIYRGCTLVLSAARSDRHPSYYSDIEFAAGAIWSCDSDDAINNKARDIRRQIAKAIEQLPAKIPSIIYCGIEAHDGLVTEKQRFAKIFNTIAYFNAKDRDIHHYYIHLFFPKVPPDQNWEFDETIYPLSRSDAIPNSIGGQPLVLDREAVEIGTFPWLV